MEREFTGGMAQVTGDFDRSVCFGITTTYYGASDGKCPEYSYFKSVIDKEFEELKNKHLMKGRDIIIPAPIEEDLLRQPETYFYRDLEIAQYLLQKSQGKHPLPTVDITRKKQIIFHNIGNIYNAVCLCMCFF